MNKVSQTGRIAEAFRDGQMRATVILLSSTLLMITWKCFGSADFYREHFASHFIPIYDEDFSAAAYMFLSAFFLLGLIPALMVKFWFRQNLSSYGLSLGDVKKLVIIVLVLLPVIFVISYVGTRDPSLSEFHPVNRSGDRNFVLHAFLFLAFYIGWEFHFRAFLQHGLESSMGWVKTYHRLLCWE